MKRGTKLLFYISSVAFCCFFMLFIGTNLVNAETTFTYTCVDKDTETECNADSVNFYYAVSGIGVDDTTIVDITIPATYNDPTYGEGSVEQILSNVITSTDSLSLDSITLPNSLVTINDNAFNNVASIKNVTIPTSVMYIGSSIFNNATVDNIYLNHYQDSDFYFVEIDGNAFMYDGSYIVDKIVCGSHSIYNYYATHEESTLKEAPIVAFVTYNYYSYENENAMDILDTKTYYIGKNQFINYVPEELSVSGLTFNGWYLKQGDRYTKIELLQEVTYALETTTYNVYPKFSLNELTFNINATDADGKSVTSQKYNGKDNLIKLSTENVSHELIAMSDSNFSYSIEWKNGEDTITSNEGVIYLSEVKDSGTYTCIVNYSYVYQGTTYTASAQGEKTISITEAPLYVIVEDVAKTYGEYLVDTDIKYNVNGLLENDTLTNIVYEYPNTGNIFAGSYANEIKVEVTSVLDDGEEKIDNYNLIYSYGTYIVNTKSLNVYYTETKEFSYGSEIVISGLYKHTAYGMYDNTITVYFSKEAGIDVGEYEIEGVKDISDDNYVTNFDSSLTTGKVIITPKKVATYVDVDSKVYTGEVKKLDVYYIDVNDMKVNLNYSISSGSDLVNEIVDSGSYVINIDSLGSNNYDFVDSSYRRIGVSISKATPVVRYELFQKFTYSGSKIKPLITIDNNEQTEVTYTCMLGSLSDDNNCINSGIYNVVVTYSESKNYERFVSSPIELTISRKIINISPSKFNFYYGENIDTSEKLTIDGEEVLLQYSTNATSTSSIGNYNITGVIIKNTANGADHSNYIGALLFADGENKVEIRKRPMKIVFYNYDGLVYNGKERVVGAYAVDNLSNKVIDDIDVSVACDEGIIKDAKTYHLRAYFESDIYESVNSNLLVFSIAKATYDISNITFKDAKFTLDFKDHWITIDGALPEGVEVKYTIDGEEGNSTSSAFSHTVVASFIVDSQNYLEIESLQASIYIDMSWVFVTFAIVFVLAGIAVCLVLLYWKYRREHPKKIKLKIKNLVKEDLEAKRVATSVKEVLGDEQVESEQIENEDDIIEDASALDSFIDRIYAADSELKYYYSEVKNELLSYEGITHSVDRKYEVFHHGTRQIAKLSICNNILRLYVNLDPDKYDKKQYNHRDMSDFECHAKTPLRIDVNTTESLRHAKVFIRILRKKENLKAVSSFVRIDYEKFYTLKENVFPRLFKKMFSIDDKKKEDKD